MSNIDVSKIESKHLIVAFLISVIFPALWMAFDWNGNTFNKYLAGDISLGSYLIWLLGIFLILYVIGCFIALGFGIPFFFALRKFLNFNILTVCLIAAVIAILPNVIVSILGSFAREDTSYYRIGDCITIENGKRTACGWEYFWINHIFWVALPGASAGIPFWFIIKKFAEK